MFFLHFLFYRVNIKAIDYGKDEVIYSSIYMISFFVSIQFTLLSFILPFFYQNFEEIDTLTLYIFTYSVASLLTYFLFYFKNKNWNNITYKKSKLNAIVQDWMILTLPFLILFIGIIYEFIIDF